MPEYRGLIKIGDAYLGGKKVVKKHRGNNLFYSAYLPVGTGVWPITGNQVFVGEWKQSSKDLYSGVTYNHTNTVVLNVPIEKIQTGLQFNFGSVSIKGINYPFLPIFYSSSFGNYYYNTNSDSNVDFLVSDLIAGVSLPPFVQVTKADLITGNKVVLIDGNKYFVKGGSNYSAPSIIYIQLQGDNLIFTSSGKTAELSNDVAMIKGSSSVQMGSWEYEFPIFSSITAY